MTERIEGQVAQILNARELVINRGEGHGVEVGMRFAILNTQGVGITDPETGELMGNVELPKTVVKVVRVHPRMAVARTFRTTRTRGGPLWSPAFEGLSSPPRVVVETLKTDEERLQDELSEEDSFVKIGDPAVQVVAEDFSDDEPMQ